MNELEDFVYIENWFCKENNRGMRLGIRYFTMQAALNLFLQTGKKRIIETGTMKMANDWGCGCSTHMFGSVCKKYGKILHTVDIAQYSINICKELTLCYRDFIVYHCQDSVEFLLAFKDKDWEEVGLLYLDSVDPPFEGDATEAQTHQLNEFKAAEKKLPDDAVLLLDDNHVFNNGGKPKMLKEYLVSLGDWVCVFDYAQSLWIRR